MCPGHPHACMSCSVARLLRNQRRCRDNDSFSTGSSLKSFQPSSSYCNNYFSEIRWYNMTIYDHAETKANSHQMMVQGGNLNMPIIIMSSCAIELWSGPKLQLEKCTQSHTLKKTKQHLGHPVAPLPCISHVLIGLLTRSLRQTSV